MEELEDKVEDETKDHVDFGGGAEFESEIEAIVGAPEPTKESDAVELATWKQTRTNMTQEKHQSVSENTCDPDSTSITRNFPKPDLAVLAGRIWCFYCREVGHFSRNCRRETCSQHLSETVACELFLPIWRNL